MLAFAGTSVHAADMQDNEWSVDAPRIQQYLAGEFPREYAALGGLFTLTARDPELSIPATGQRLRMAFSASASSAGGADTPVGRIHLSSGLRYDPRDNALYLDQPTLDEVFLTLTGSVASDGDADAEPIATDLEVPA